LLHGTAIACVLCATGARTQRASGAGNNGNAAGGSQALGTQAIH